MNNDIEALNTIMMIYIIPTIVFLIVGIIVIIMGYGKEKKALKLAGVVITAMGIQFLLIIGAFILYFKFIESLVG